MPAKKHNLSAPDAIQEMKKELERMRELPDELSDLSPDEAFNHGYNVAIHDFQSYTGPNPRFSKGTPA